MRSYTWILALMTASSAAIALPTGKDLLPPDGLFAMTFKGDSASGKVSKVGTGKKDALRLETLIDVADPWDVQAQAVLASKVEKGDRILATFWMRGVRSRAESGEASTEFVFERLGEPWTKSIEYPVKAAQQWRQMQIPFEAAEDYAPGKAQIVFRMGYPAQSFEIKDFDLVNYGKAVPFSALPRTRVTYPGRNADAPWRKEAEGRIKKYRMAPLAIHVVDKNGKPVEGAKIEVTQTKNAFHFGTAVSGRFMFRSGEDHRQYAAAVAKYFNMATEENAFKWPTLEKDWEGGWGMDLALQSQAWIRSLGLDFRGHCLIWPSWRNMPKSALALKNDKVALRKAVFKHIRDTALAVKGKAAQWDVMNEPFDNHDLMDIYGDSIMPEFFRTAREADPKAELFINDYAILSGGGEDTPHRRHYEKTLKYLVDQKTPFEGIGMQGHFGYSVTSPDDLLKLLDRYAVFGKKIMVTEYDIDVNDPDLAGDYTRDLLTILYSHPAAAGFVMWGFWDGAHWHRNAPLFNRDWSPKPALRHWDDLVLHAWRTQANGSSDALGAFATRGHLGDYEIKVTKDGKSVLKKAVLDKKGLNLALKMI
ncbi:MAG: endo-1,4-beta-xylanase [candidate division FCPU426 bacterium]